ncbi:MAG: tRNA preQ1(34) S-adenosylmethionine ribosyltransferase-isomerase QueA [Acidobacteria bacterium]|nr:tRNA preQ1(34) S-adenosylmethionine ribosyltransferase-isomerase QueA [Acidobacteriota bacterium]
MSPLSVSAFDFDLPPELIAQHPSERGASRLLVVHRDAGCWEEATIRELPSRLRRNDLLVANDTRVFPARLLGRRDPSGGAVECLLLEQTAEREWQALVHPGQKLKPGARLVFDDPTRAPGVRLTGEVLERHFFGRRTIRLDVAGADSVDEAIDALGHVPLPPYIHRPDSAEDRERYQTVFAVRRGSIAAPTAGLHFDEALLQSLRDAGIGWATVTLHVGYGTFKPVRVEQVEAHRVDAERYAISSAAARAIADARAAGGRVIAVGTTTTRALESAATAPANDVPAGSGVTDLFIHPGYRFRAIDGLLTNFHLPRSSLLMLVAAFGGVDLIMAAYRHAVSRGFRFYSYGDAMLVL